MPFFKLMIENTAVKDPRKLPTYTSPNSKLALIFHLRQNIWIRKYSALKIVRIPFKLSRGTQNEFRYFKLKAL